MRRKQNRFRVIHSKSDETIIVLHNIDGVERDFKDLEKRLIKRLFEHFSVELQKTGVLNKVSMTEIERKISFSDKDTKNVINAIQNGIKVSSQSTADDDDMSKLGSLLGLQDNKLSDEEASALKSKLKASAESAHLEDWRDLSSDVMPFLKSLVPTENRSTALSQSKSPGFFSRLCCCIPSRPKEAMEEHLIQNSYQ